MVKKVISLDQYCYEILESIVGETVSVFDDTKNEVPLTVAGVRKNAMDGEEWEAFSVSFQGEKRFHIPQGTYTFKHAKFGEKSLFVSPNSDIEYETVVCRQREIPADETC